MTSARAGVGGDAEGMAMSAEVTVSDRAYKMVDGPPLSLRMFRLEATAGEPLRPAIVFFFGGGWRVGALAQFEPQCRHLARGGWIAFAAAYRIRSVYGTSPLEAMADARSAIRWIRAHSQELGVDPARIVAAGGSAGGHIAVCSALIQTAAEPGEDAGTPAAPDALVLFNPVLDTTEMPLARELLGSRAQEASPLHHVAPAAPPTIIFHGTADVVVPFDQAVAFTERMRAMGNRCELVPFQGAGHGFFNLGRGEGSAYRDTLARTEAFLAALGMGPA